MLVKEKKKPTESEVIESRNVLTSFMNASAEAAVLGNVVLQSCML